MLRTAILALFLAYPLVAADRPPNVVLVYVDDMGYGDLACYGNKQIRTPSIDKLAADGVRFTDFYVAQAVCSASRARAPDRAATRTGSASSGRSGRPAASASTTARRPSPRC